MIVRILDEGQYELDEDGMDRIHSLDADLGQALASGNGAWFEKALTALVTEVREVGRPVEPTMIVPSDLAVPAEGSSLEEVRRLLESGATTDLA